MRVTIYRGGAQPQTLAAPCIIAFRPGYRYRLQLGGMKDEPKLTLSPSLDVLGSLRLTSGMKAADYPATLLFTDDDFAMVRAGSVVNKVVVLERPETALPVATRADQPLEITVPPNRDPLQDAQDRGRPLLVLHMGERDVTPQEMQAQGIPGTMLLPGEKVLPPPRDPPCLPWWCYPLVDPLAGQSSPADEVCFHDGGDGGLRAGIGPDGKLVGLDPSDTVAQYIDSRGNKKIAISNRVCFCVPRYLIIRTAITTASNSVRTNTGDTRLVQAPRQTQTTVGSVEREWGTRPGGLLGRTRPSGITNIEQTQVVGKMEGLLLVSHVVYTGHVTGRCPEPTLAEPSDKPLVIIKWPDHCDPQLGDVVTFFIRYRNQGLRPITGIVVSDSLTTRLEYVPGSARTDRDALFTTTPNEAESAVLRWEITAPLPPGQSGTVSFQARVR
jgi:uncharacterized repeat protein (TIGR01451 family)